MLPRPTAEISASNHRRRRSRRRSDQAEAQLVRRRKAQHDFSECDYSWHSDLYTLKSRDMEAAIDVDHFASRIRQKI
jgi:hypothetical protein